MKSTMPPSPIKIPYWVNNDTNYKLKIVISAYKILFFKNNKI